MIKIAAVVFATVATIANAGSLRSTLESETDLTSGYVTAKSGCRGKYCALSCPGRSGAWFKKNGKYYANGQTRTTIYQGKPHNYPKHGNPNGIANVQCCDGKGKAFRSNKQKWYNKPGKKFHCVSGKTRNQANTICEKANMRLCTAQEACFNDLGAGTGCNFDQHNVWWVVCSVGSIFFFCVLDLPFLFSVLFLFLFFFVYKMFKFFFFYLQGLGHETKLRTNQKRFRKLDFQRW